VSLLFSFISKESERELMVNRKSLVYKSELDVKVAQDILDIITSGRKYKRVILREVEIRQLLLFDLI
jgi:hypothetical protein